MRETSKVHGVLHSSNKICTDKETQNVRDHTPYHNAVRATSIRGLSYCPIWII